MNTIQLSTIINNLLNINRPKLKYAIRSNLIEGLFTTLKENYHVKLTEEVFELFYDILNEKLSGSPDIEYEFDSEEEYNNIINLKIKYCKEK